MITPKLRIMILLQSVTVKILDIPTMSSSVFSNVTEAPPIEVFYMNKLYVDDPAPQKVNLTIGAYRTEEGKPWVLPVVRQATKILAEDDTINHEYLPVLGYEPFTKAASELVLGADSPAIKEGRVCMGFVAFFVYNK